MPFVKWLKTLPGDPLAFPSVDPDAIVAGATSDVDEVDAVKAVAAGLAERIAEKKPAKPGKE